MINPHATTETIERQLELFRVARAAAGLSPATEQPAVREIFCAGDRQLAIETVQPHLAEKYSVYARWGQDKVLPGDESFDIPFDQLARGRFIVGTPEDCIEQLLPWRDRLGVDHFIFRTHWSGTPTEISIASMKLLAQEVMPALRDD